MSGERATVPELIAQKRDGVALSAADIDRLVRGFVSGEVADYQMAALAMAVFFRGMDAQETASLTLAMRDSGTVLDVGAIVAPKIDKHSTGGVGDKVSLCLAPLVAACGVAVPMVAGRGLGHTGGTLDKLEAIPGFSVTLSAEAFVRQVHTVGVAIMGQTAQIAPADRQLYALRDVTATVESIPLITASILSKKLAAGLDGLVLDVKTGSGAFMKDIESARRLARCLVDTGKLAGLPVRALLTRMDAPLGLAIGNALEVVEAIEVLRDVGPPDLRECTLLLGAEMLEMAGVATDAADARRQLLSALASGAALEKFVLMVIAQGGDPRVIDDPVRLSQSPLIVDLQSDESGYIHGIDAMAIGALALHLGAGRSRAEQRIDAGVGVVLARQVGDAVRSGDLLARLHLPNDGESALHLHSLRQAFHIAASPYAPPPLFIEALR